MLLPIAWVGPETVAIVAVVVLLLFGGKKIPELMRGLGQGLGEFKKGAEEAKTTFREAIKEEPAATVPTAETKATPKDGETK